MLMSVVHKVAQAVIKPEIHVEKFSLCCYLIPWWWPRDLLPREAIPMWVAYEATWVNAEAHGPCSHWGLWGGQWSWCGQGPCWYLRPCQGCHLNPCYYPWEWKRWIYPSWKSFPSKGHSTAMQEVVCRRTSPVPFMRLYKLITNKNFSTIILSFSAFKSNNKTRKNNKTWVK